MLPKKSMLIIQISSKRPSKQSLGDEWKSMEIHHRIVTNPRRDPEVYATIIQLEISHKIAPLPGREDGVVFLDIVESDPRWKKLAEQILKFGASDIYNTVFSVDEIRQGHWCRLSAVFEQGYPQPQSTWSVDRITYQNVCPECGVYESQREPFRIKKEPDLGRRSFMTLHWGDGVFARPAVFAEFAANELSGYEPWDVLIHRTGQKSQSISQVFVPSVTQCSFVPETELERTMCSTCRTVKYHPHLRGYMRYPSDLMTTEYDFVMSKEWFGSGHMAFREMLVSHRVANLILEKSWKGVQLKPIQIV